MRYKQKQIEIEAIQVKHGYKNLDEIIKFVGKDNMHPIERRPDYILKIKVRGGDSRVIGGDYIIKNSDGTFSVWGELAFERTYVESESPAPTDKDKLREIRERVCQDSIVSNKFLDPSENIVEQIQTETYSLGKKDGAREKGVEVIDELEETLELAYEDMRRGAYCLDGTMEEDVPLNVVETTSASGSLIIAIRSIQSKLNQLKNELL